MADELPQDGPIQRVEESTHIGVHYHPDATSQAQGAQLVKRLVSAVVGAEPVGEDVEVLLVHGCHHHGHGSLRNLVFQRGYPDRTFAAVVFVQPSSAHRWGHVATRAQTLVQASQVAEQVGPVLVCRHVVHSSRLVLAGAHVGFVQQRHVDQVCQRREDSIRIADRLVHNRSEGWEDGL